MIGRHVSLKQSGACQNRWHPIILSPHCKRLNNKKRLFSYTIVRHADVPRLSNIWLTKHNIEKDLHTRISARLTKSPEIMGQILKRTFTAISRRLTKLWTIVKQIWLNTSLTPAIWNLDWFMIPWNDPVVKFEYLTCPNKVTVVQLRNTGLN